MEQKILATALNSASDAKQIEELLDQNTLSPEGQLVLKAALAWYATDPNTERVDRELLVKGFDRTISKDKIRSRLTEVVRNLPTDVSGSNVVKEIREHKAHVIGQKLAQLLASGASTGDVAPVLASYQQLVAGELEAQADSEEQFTNTSITELVKTRFDPSELIQIWPMVLNERLDGGCRRGHHVCVFAPTEMGKTLFVLNAVAGFLSQGLRILYVGNEDPASDIIMRLATRMLERTKHEILDHPEEADDILRDLNWSNFTLVSMAPGTFGRINALCASSKFDVVVLDQLRNIDVKSGNRTEGLERAATEARNLARRHNVLVVSVTQAADSASGKRVLNRGDVDSSNVGIPGQMDLMIGIGATEQDEQQGIRTLSFPKNKVSGNHEPLYVNIDPTISKVIDGNT